jgi:hypothetical protein
MEIAACGVLPFSYHNKEIYILCGKDKFYPDKESSEKFCGFGGSMNEKETYKDCASRECYEESMGFLGHRSIIREKLNESHKDYIGKLNYLKYQCYYINIPYEEHLPKHFKNVYNYVLESGGMKNSELGMYEKSDIKWIKLNYLFDIIYKKKKDKQREFTKGFLDMTKILMENRTFVFSLKKLYKE